jgi:hypothetical protein
MKCLRPGEDRCPGHPGWDVHRTLGQPVVAICGVCGRRLGVVSLSAVAWDSERIVGTFPWPDRRRSAYNPTIDYDWLTTFDERHRPRDPEARRP